MTDGIGVRLITLDEVSDRVPFSKVHIYRLIGRGEFPGQIEVGPQRVAWIESEVDDWIADRMRRRAGIGTGAVLRKELAAWAAKARHTCRDA